MWYMLCKRTNDPKLAWVEAHLQDMGIQTRRSGHSFHAPILEVPVEHADAAEAFLASGWKRTRFTVDDIRDDHPDFLTLPEVEAWEDELSLLQKAGLNMGQP